MGSRSQVIQCRMIILIENGTNMKNHGLHSIGNFVCQRKRYAPHSHYGSWEARRKRCMIYSSQLISASSVTPRGTLCVDDSFDLNIDSGISSLSLLAMRTTWRWHARESAQSSLSLLDPSRESLWVRVRDTSRLCCGS